MPRFHNPMDSTGFHFMGSMPYEEFIRRFNKAAGKPQPKRRYPPKPRAPKATKPKAKPRKAQEPAYTKQAMTNEQSVFDWNRLKWQALYIPEQICYVKDHANNRLTVTVPHYHSQTYRMDEMMQDYIRYHLKRGIPYTEIISSPACLGTDLTDIWRWLIDTARFPFPIEEPLHTRPGYIDLKKTFKPRSVS